jgi:hypothetical protein
MAELTNVPERTQIQKTINSEEAKNMEFLRSIEEVHANEQELIAIYCFYLHQKGYKKTIMSEVMATEIEEAKEKYNLSESISDFDFGAIEGKLKFSMTLRGFYDEKFDGGHIAWIKFLISECIDKIWCFILRCALNKPRISTSSTYDFAGQMKTKLEDLVDVYRAEVNSWHRTPYELGQVCGFVSAAHWAIGDEWAFSEDDFDAPIDWESFHSYINNRALRLKKRKLQEMSGIFQLYADIYAVNDNGGPMRGIHYRAPSEAVDNNPALPEVSSWLDW